MGESIINKWEKSVESKIDTLDEKLKADLNIAALTHVADAINSKLAELKEARSKLG